MLHMHQYKAVSMMSLAPQVHGQGGYAGVTALHDCVNAGLSTVCSSASKHNSMNTFKRAQGKGYPDFSDKIVKEKCTTQSGDYVGQDRGPRSHCQCLQDKQQRAEAGAVGANKSVQNCMQAV